MRRIPAGKSGCGARQIVKDRMFRIAAVIPEKSRRRGNHLHPLQNKFGSRSTHMGGMRDQHDPPDARIPQDCCGKARVVARIERIALQPAGHDTKVMPQTFRQQLGLSAHQHRQTAAMRQPTAKAQALKRQSVRYRPAILGGVAAVAGAEDHDRLRLVQRLLPQERHIFQRHDEQIDAGRRGKQQGQQQPAPGHPPPEPRPAANQKQAGRDAQQGQQRRQQQVRNDFLQQEERGQIHGMTRAEKRALSGKALQSTTAGGQRQFGYHPPASPTGIMPAPMSVRCHEDFASLRACHPDTAPDVALSPFETLDWFELLAREALPAETRLHLLVASPEQRPALILPLMWQGTELASLSNYYTGIYGPPGDPIDHQTLDEMCRHLRKSRPRPTVVRLQPLDPRGEAFIALRQAFSRAGYLTGSHFCFGNWHLPCAGLRFADYLAQRSSALRNTVRRGRGHLGKEGRWDIMVHTRAGEELEQALADYERIYRKSWKPTETYPNFIRQLCRLAARHGWLRLGVLRLDGIAIASQIWLFDNGTAYIFKLAYDPDASRFSPGSILTAAMIEYALDQDQAREIDYLSGDDTYKQDWMTHRRERHGLVAFDAATPHGIYSALRHFGGKLRHL